MAIREIEGKQCRLAVDDEGEGGDGGVPVLFVHSDGGNMSQWREALEHLRPRRRAIVFDLRGCGGSGSPRDKDFAMAGRAEDIGAVVDALALERLVLVGHSGGGAVALQYAADDPDRVAALLLVDPVGDGRRFPEEQRRHFMDLLHSDAYAETVSAYYASIAGPNEATRARVVRDVLATPAETMIGTFTELSAFDPMPALRGYRGKRLSVHTPHNELPGSLHKLDRTLPHRRIEGTGHWIHLDEPALFHGILDDFLALTPSTEAAAPQPSGRR